MNFFSLSSKTKAPSYCGLGCCGNKFGRIERSTHSTIHNVNRVILSRRYAKHVERQAIRRDILAQLNGD